MPSFRACPEGAHSVQRQAATKTAFPIADNIFLIRRFRTTWWLWRGVYTRSHPELGRENPQRRWYCVSRRGRVGRRPALPAESTHTPTPKPSSPTAGQGPAPKLIPWPCAKPLPRLSTAGWSSPVARQAHNLKVVGSNPTPASRKLNQSPNTIGGASAIAWRKPNTLI